MSIRFLSNELIEIGAPILNSNLGYFNFDFFAEKVLRIVLKKILCFIFEILQDKIRSFSVEFHFKK
ncbi:hypothetical protein FF021_07380 [Leptospira noguchii]|nr:hypothetical protein FF021_07380 [Leptospira noguchii]